MSAGAIVIIVIAASGVLMMRFRKRWLAKINIAFTNRITGLFAEIGNVLDLGIRRTDEMPHFVSLLRYTQQGIAKIKESPARLDAAKKAAEKAGGKIHSWHLTMGQYDAVIISEFPNDEACAKFTLSVGALGNVTTETLKAFTEAEYRKIIGVL